jgi:hypothetical protein
MRYWLCLVLLGFNAPLTLAGTALPTRQQCVVAYSMQWLSSQRNPSDVLSEMSVSPGLAKSVYLAGVSTPSDAVVYLQFTQNCENRIALSERIVQEWRKIVGAPKFVHVEQAVQLGPSTIEIRGPHWRD